MKSLNGRVWLVLGAAGCAQLAGFEDFHGGTGGGTGGALSQAGGRAANGGRGGAAAPATAGEFSDAGASQTGTGNGGTSSSTGGRAASTGGASAGGSSPGGESGNPGGAGGETGGMAGVSGAVAAGGSETGGTAAGGNATGNTGGNATGGVPTATGGGPNTTGCGELIFNGDFSHGPDGWLIESDYLNFEQNVHEVIVPIGYPKLEPYGVTPESDSYLGWFGGVPTSSEKRLVMASQVVTISENVDVLEFRGMYRIDSDEDADMAYDDFYAELRTIEEDTELGWQFEHLSNLDENSVWTPMDVQQAGAGDLDFLRGRSFYFMLYSRTDLDVRTDFWIDSISLVAVCP